MLMEIDFLLRDFAATPIGIDDWATAEDFQRQRRFGFGQLRTREERRRGMPDDVVLPERDQWATHSVHSHPLPSKDVEPAPSHPSFSLLASLTDLLDHARNVTLSGRTVVLSVAGVLPPGYDEFPNTAGFEFRSKVSWLLESHIPSEDMIGRRSRYLPSTGRTSHVAPKVEIRSPSQGVTAVIMLTRLSPVGAI